MKDYPKDEIPEKRLAWLLENIDNKFAAKILSTLEEIVPGISKKIDETYNLPDFEIISDMFDFDLCRLFPMLDINLLARALVGSSEKIKIKVFNNISKRAKKMLLEELEYLKNIDEYEIKIAQKKICKIIGKKKNEGDIIDMLESEAASGIHEVSSFQLIKRLEDIQLKQIIEKFKDENPKYWYFDFCLALITATTELKNKFMSCLSDEMQEEIEFSTKIRGPVLPIEVNEAQERIGLKIMSIIKQESIENLTVV